MADRWRSLPIRCEGGLVLNLDALTQGTDAPGSARILENYEPALEGGYKRILGKTKFSNTTVPGDSSSAILGVKVGLGGVVACRKDSTSYDLHFGTGTSWTKINTATRTNAVTKMRGVDSAIIAPAVIILDGANPALKYDGSTDTLINGTGAPTNPKYGAVYRNRFCLAGHSADPSELIISEANTDIGYNGGSGAASIPCSDTIVGLKTFRETLYIFCRNSIKQLTGTSASDFAIVDVTNSIGCVSGDTIQELGGDLLYLSPDGYRSLAATERINDLELGLVSKAIQPLIREQSLNSYAPELFSSIVIRPKSQIRLYINGIQSEANSVGFLGKLQQGRAADGTLAFEWSVLRGVKPYCADSSYEANKEIAVIGDTTTGYVYSLESGNSFDGSAIAYRYRSPDLTFTDSTIRKVFQKLETYTQVGGDAQVNVRMILDRGVTTVPQPTADVFGQTGVLPTYGTAVYDTSVYGALEYPVFKINLIGAAFTAAFEWSGSDTTREPHRIDAFQIIFAPKGYR